MQSQPNTCNRIVDLQLTPQLKEEEKLRYSEAVEKMRETGGIRMIIGEIL